MPYKDPEKQKAFQAEWSKTHRKRLYFKKSRLKRDIQTEINSYKAERGCANCGEMDPACLDLHHKDPSEKEVAPADMARNRWARERIAKELVKCMVLCANCHRKLHIYGRLV